MKNLCVTIPTTTTLLGDEARDISEKVVVHETALRFLDSTSVSPTAKNTQSASAFFRNEMLRDPKSVQSSRRKGDYEVKFVIGTEKDTHKEQLAALTLDQEIEDAKRQKIKRSVQVEQSVNKFNVTATPFFKAYYKIGAQSGVERINADTVSLPPITSKIQVIEKFTEQSTTHTNNLKSPSLCSGKMSTSVPDLKNGRISGVLLATAAFQSCNYDIDNAEKEADSPSQKIDMIAAYVPSATVNDIREMKRIYTQLEELSDGSGHIYCVGGLSFYEVMIRVIAPKKSTVLQDELYTFKKGVPFNPVRRQIVSLCQKIAFERGIKARELLFDNKVRIYPKSFDDVWPLGVAELITITGISGKFSSTEHVNLPIGYGSDYTTKPTQAAGGEQKSSRHGQTNQSTSQRQLSLTQQSVRTGGPRHLKKEAEAPPIELIYSIQDQLLKHLDSLFLRSVLELVEVLKGCGVLISSDPVHAKLLDIYIRHRFNKPPSPITDPEGTEWVSCHITERVDNGPSFSDIYRYLEGFIIVANWSTLHSGIALDFDECSMLCTKIISPITAALSLCISRIFLHVYIKPLASVMTEADIKSQIREATLSKQSATVDDLILDLLRRKGKALTELELSKYRNRYYGPFMKRIYAKREEAIADCYTKEQIHNVHILVKKLQEVSVLPDIVTESGARELIEYISSVMLNMDMSTLSTSLFRVLRGKYLTKYKTKCEIPTPLAIRKHLAYHVHICILAAKVAALKVVEEIYPLHIHTHVGRVFEYDALTQIDLIIDSTGIFKNSLNRFINCA